MNEQLIAEVSAVLVAWNPLGSKTDSVPDLNGYRTEAIDIIKGLRLRGKSVAPEKTVSDVLNQAFRLTLKPIDCAAPAKEIQHILRPELNPAGDGEPLAVFRPRRLRIALLYAAAFVVVLAPVGSGLLGTMLKEGWWPGLLGLAPFLGNAALLCGYAWYSDHCRVLLYPRGFAVVRPSRVQEFPWSHVTGVREYGEGWLWRPAPGELTGKGSSYEVVRDDGQVFGFRRGELADWGALRGRRTERGARPRHTHGIHRYLRLVEAEAPTRVAWDRRPTLPVSPTPLINA